MFQDKRMPRYTKRIIFDGGYILAQHRINHDTSGTLVPAPPRKREPPTKEIPTNPFCRTTLLPKRANSSLEMSSLEPLVTNLVESRCSRMSLFVCSRELVRSLLCFLVGACTVSTLCSIFLYYCLVLHVRCIFLYVYVYMLSSTTICECLRSNIVE